MTLMKSLLLGSTATIIAVASAQAADLPTKKGAPAAAYVKICTITANGTAITGFVLPGSDTCLKISGLVTAQYWGHSVDDELKAGVNSFSFFTSPGSFSLKPPFTFTPPGTQVPFGLTGSKNGAANLITADGDFVRGQVNFDAVSNTPMGPLLSHIEVQGNYSGFTATPGDSSFALNAAYISWAGLTLGKHVSYYDFLAGGAAWDDIISPDHSGTPIMLAAYTASFGGGLSATVSAEEPENLAYNNSNDAFTVLTPTFTFPFLFSWSSFPGTPNVTNFGERSPDIVVSLDASQAWGKVHLAGVAHQVHEFAGTSSFFSNGGGTFDQWGWGVIGGLQINLPSLGNAADNISFQGAWTRDATEYSGLTRGADQGAGPVTFNENGNGVAFQLSDAYQNAFTGAWAIPTAWSLAAILDVTISPQFRIRPEISYGSIDYGSNASWFLSKSANEWLGGAVLDWIPVTNLDFSLDLLYGALHQSTPLANAFFGSTSFQNNSDGFDGRLRVERDF
jgi:hypothetical protein